MQKSLTVVAVAAALNGGTPIISVAAAPQPADDASLSSWMHSWHVATDECRGSYPDDPAHVAWCDLEEKMSHILETHGCKLVSLGTSIGSMRWACRGSVFGDPGN